MNKPHLSGNHPPNTWKCLQSQGSAQGISCPCKQQGHEVQSEGPELQKVGGQETPQSRSCLKVSHLWGEKKSLDYVWLSFYLPFTFFANTLQCLAFLLQGALDNFFSLLFQEVSRFMAITHPLSQIQTSPASFQQKLKLTSSLAVTGIIGNHFTGIRGALSVCSGLDWGLLGHHLLT